MLSFHSQSCKSLLTLSQTGQQQPRLDWSKREVSIVDFVEIIRGYLFFVGCISTSELNCVDSDQIC